MFQKEVAERLAARPGSDGWGRLARADPMDLRRVEYLFKLPKGAFSPPPEVESAVVRLTPRREPNIAATSATLSSILAAAFGQRRKMLRQSLKPSRRDPAALLASIGIDPTRRAETLDLDEFAESPTAAARPPSAMSSG